MNKKQAFELYGGVAGFFDYGPIGCMLKNNIIGTDITSVRSHGPASGPVRTVRVYITYRYLEEAFRRE